MNTRLWFVGSHGTGKTTQLEHFVTLHPHFHVVKSDRRKLLEEGVIKINREAAPWDEIVIGGDVMRHQPQVLPIEVGWISVRMLNYCLTLNT
jgi:hypothetical protein